MGWKQWTWADFQPSFFFNLYHSTTEGFKKKMGCCVSKFRIYFESYGHANKLLLLHEELTNLWEVVVLLQEPFPPEQVRNKGWKILHLIKTKFILSMWLCKWARAAAGKQRASRVAQVVLVLSLLVVMLISRAGQDMNAACPKLFRQQRCFSQPKAVPVKQLRGSELVKGVITVLEVEFVLSCIHSLNQWPQDCPGHWREKSSPGGHESHPLQVLLLFKHLVLCQILLEL